MAHIARLCIAFACAGLAAPALSQQAAQPAAQAPAGQASGPLVIVPAYGTVKAANDQATIIFTIEEQDRDKTQAASRVNQKMKEGMAIIRREDPQAVLRTRGYYTFPVYPEDRPVVQGQPARRVATSWRAGQTLEVKTTNLAAVEKMTAAAQRILSLNGVHFSLTEAASTRLDEQRIAATYRNLTERIAAIAKAMGRRASDAVIETVDFEGSGAYAPEQAQGAPAMMAMRGMAKDASVEEPSFEPGETEQQMRVVGRVRFR